jgi:hypothetical protein
MSEIGSVIWLEHCTNKTVLEFKLRASHLLGRCSTTMRHATGSFCFCYYSTRFGVFLPGWPGPQSSYLHLQHSWVWHIYVTMPSFIGWDGSSTNFLPGLASNHNPPNHHLPSQCTQPTKPYFNNYTKKLTLYSSMIVDSNSKPNLVFHKQI